MTIPVDEAWLKANERERSANDALRARVRTLEGALTATLNEATDASDAGDYARALKHIEAALSGAQPDTGNGKLHNRPDGEQCSYLAEKFCNKCGWVETSGAQPDTALAEREASIVELRRALEHIHESVTYNLSHKASVDMQRMIEAALAQPAPQAALRAMLRKTCNNLVHRLFGFESTESLDATDKTIDAVLKGES